MFEEYEDRETPESKLTKQLDVFDAVLQVIESNFNICIRKLVTYYPHLFAGIRIWEER